MSSAAPLGSNSSVRSHVSCDAVLNSNDSHTPGGARIYNHPRATGDPIVALRDVEALDILAKHLSLHFGGDYLTAHEDHSKYVHLDILCFPPQPTRSYYVLATSGMSDKPMIPPEGAEGFRYSELIMGLPSDWQLNQPVIRNDKYYWPMRWLGMLARFPHVFDTWIWHGHTIPNLTISFWTLFSQRAMTGAILTHPTLLKDGSDIVECKGNKRIYLHSVIPLYNDEMDYAVQFGPTAILERLSQCSVDEILDPSREPVVKKKRSFW